MALDEIGGDVPPMFLVSRGDIGKFMQIVMELGVDDIIDETLHESYAEYEIRVQISQQKHACKMTKMIIDHSIFSAQCV